jgi:HK97 gp10 family phage protein
MAVELTGSSELIADLAGMAADLDNGPGVDRALQAGAVPVEQQMLANASSDPKIITGALHGSIRTDRVKQRRGGKQISIGVKHSEAGAYYANPVEYGHGGPGPAPPHPFVRPAFDARAEEAYGEIKRVLADEIMNRS